MSERKLRRMSRTELIDVIDTLRQDETPQLRAYCAEQGLRVLGELPFDRAAAETYAKGRLIAATSPEWRVRFESLRDAVLTFAEGACHA